MNKAKIGKWVRLAVSAAIIVLLIIFARKVDWGQAWHAMVTASRPLLLAALLANLVTLIARGIRWWILLRAVGARSLPLAMRATFAGAGLNNVLVANGGDAARIVFVTRSSGVSASKVLATAALDRLFDPIGFVILLAGGLAMFDLPPLFSPLRWPALIASRRHRSWAHLARANRAGDGGGAHPGAPRCPSRVARAIARVAQGVRRQHARACNRIAHDSDSCPDRDRVARSAGDLRVRRPRRANSPSDPGQPGDFARGQRVTGRACDAGQRWLLSVCIRARCCAFRRSGGQRGWRRGSDPGPPDHSDYPHRQSRWHRSSSSAGKQKRQRQSDCRWRFTGSGGAGIRTPVRSKIHHSIYVRSLRFFVSPITTRKAGLRSDKVSRVSQLEGNRP